MTHDPAAPDTEPPATAGRHGNGPTVLDSLNLNQRQQDLLMWVQRKCFVLVKALAKHFAVTHPICPGRHQSLRRVGPS